MIPEASRSSAAMISGRMPPTMSHTMLDQLQWPLHRTELGSIIPSEYIESKRRQIENFSRIYDQENLGLHKPQFATDGIQMPLDLGFPEMDSGAIFPDGRLHVQNGNHVQLQLISDSQASPPQVPSPSVYGQLMLLKDQISSGAQLLSQYSRGRMYGSNAKIASSQLPLRLLQSNSKRSFEEISSRRYEEPCTPRPRWCPTPEQIQILESLFNSGTTTPSRDMIVEIAARLRKYGNIGEANVFYWFQNRKARAKRKLQQPVGEGDKEPKGRTRRVSAKIYSGSLPLSEVSRKNIDQTTVPLSSTTQGLGEEIIGSNEHEGEPCLRDQSLASAGQPSFDSLLQTETLSMPQVENFGNRNWAPLRSLHREENQSLESSCSMVEKTDCSAHLSLPFQERRSWLQSMQSLSRRYLDPRISIFLATSLQERQLPFVSTQTHNTDGVSELHQSDHGLLDAGQNSITGMLDVAPNGLQSSCGSIGGPSAPIINSEATTNVITIPCAPGEGYSFSDLSAAPVGRILNDCAAEQGLAATGAGSMDDGLGAASRMGDCEEDFELWDELGPCGEWEAATR